MRKAKASYCTYSIPGKTAPLIPEFSVEYLPSAELQRRIPVLPVKDLPVGRTLIIIIIIIIIITIIIIYYYYILVVSYYKILLILY